MSKNENLQNDPFTAWMSGKPYEESSKSKPNNNYNFVMEVAKVIIYFPISIAFAWIAVWAVNLGEWGMSISIGSFIKSAFLISPHYSVFHFVQDAISMFPYLLVYASGFLLMTIKPWYMMRFFLSLYGLCMIAIFDPSVKYSLPKFLYDIVYLLQHKYNYYFIGGANFWDFKLSERISDIQYGLFDAFVIISMLLIIFNKDKKDINLFD